MIDIEKIIGCPYVANCMTFSADKYIGNIKCIYSKESDSFKIEIECSISENEYVFGSVDMNVDVHKFTNNGTIGFGELAVPSRICNKGVGSLLMNKVIEVARNFAEYYNPSIDKIEIKGWLSSVDYKNRNWESSLPFYQEVARKNDIDIIFIGYDSMKEYTEWKDYINYEADKDGDVVFKVKIR